jgi:hypothetical protein
MLKFVARHGLVRLIGGRAVPALLLWDLAMLANRTRRIPAVDRGLRRGAGVAMRGVESVLSSRPSVPSGSGRARWSRPDPTASDRRRAPGDAPPARGDDSRDT